MGAFPQIAGCKGPADFAVLSQNSLDDTGRGDFLVFLSPQVLQPNVLVIGDETADCFIPFLTKHYSRIDIVSADNFGEIIDKYTNKSEYEQTLFILGMEHISEKYRGE